MRVVLDVPEDLVQRLASDMNSLSRAALEALALEGIRSGKLTVSQARRLLGISSQYEMDGFLKSHGVLLPTTIEDLREESRAATPFLK